MNTQTNSKFRSILSLFLAITLALGTLTLVGCGGNKNEQDNSYGEDMPVVNN